MIFKDLTLEKLRAATKEQLATTINKELASINKKELIEFIYANQRAPTNPVIIETLTKKEDSNNGQLLRIYEITDILENKLGSKKIEWTYYPTGEVDVITAAELDAEDKIISQKTIKHYTDGRQPTILP